uniref:Uncharacterized protein n=1 Tax=viral metagenome TaxID=1070528 RepID=A0A6H2A0A8_9ZZZZ
MKKELLGFYADDIGSREYKNPTATAQGKNGRWYVARPERYKSIKATLIRLWHVLTGKADVLYWRIDEQL